MSWRMLAWRFCCCLFRFVAGRFERGRGEGGEEGGGGAVSERRRKRRRRRLPFFSCRFGARLCPRGAARCFRCLCLSLSSHHLLEALNGRRRRQLPLLHLNQHAEPPADLLHLLGRQSVDPIRKLVLANHHARRFAAAAAGPAAAAATAGARAAAAGAGFPAPGAAAQAAGRARAEEGWAHAARGRGAAAAALPAVAAPWRSPPSSCSCSSSC